MTLFFDGVPYCDGVDATSSTIAQIEYEHLLKQIRRVAYQIIAPLLVATGVVGNMLNLIVLCRPFFNSCTRTYLRVLAIADIIILLLDIPMIIRLNGKQNTNIFTAVYHAYVEIPIITTFIAFNVYVVTCLTVDRYVSVCAPTKFKSFHTSKRAKIAVVVAITISVVLSFPLILLKTVCSCKITGSWGFKDNVNITGTTYWYAYLLGSEIMMRIGPAMFVAILNILIIRQFRIITKKRNESQNTDIKVYMHRTKKYQEEKRLVILLQIIVVLFCTTMIPSSCLSIWYTIHPSRSYSFEVFRAVANLLEMTNFGLNFGAYFLCSKEFRKALLSIFVNLNVETKSFHKQCNYINRKEPIKPIATTTIHF
ncbi:hypothetical protein RN001_012034 [Aquatica leii]|uniref:G-protein coupled receptors family 1 profile domain-containing protein n=1 Tax=Aquatica leii TaxID=1421715 RepID=A0AAN7SD42_9COLE|nr:hypothetical protein RN001_012034 [Aquatica leii]